MREYIKKFESASAADNYLIVDIPFIATVDGETPINLVCNQPDKKIEINNGQIEIVNNVVKYTLSYDTQGYFVWGGTPPTEAEAGETIILNFMVSMTYTAYLEINGDYVEVPCNPSDDPNSVGSYGSYTFTMPAQNTTIIGYGGGGSNN